MGQKLIEISKVGPSTTVRQQSFDSNRYYGHQQVFVGELAHMVERPLRMR